MKNETDKINQLQITLDVGAASGRVENYNPAEFLKELKAKKKRTLEIN